MAKKNFSERVYNKSKEVVKTQSFDPVWQSFLQDIVRLEDIFCEDGPALSAATGLNRFRQAMVARAKKDGMTVPQLLIAIANAGAPKAKWNLRVTVLKILWHFSRHSKRGGQDVWIYSPPLDFTRWIYEELQGSERRVEMKLLKEEEIFSDTEKNVMVQALQIALSCSQKAMHLLAKPTDTTLEAVTRWFCDDKSTSKDVQNILDKLSAGFKKITNTCNSNKLIFADDPNDRKLGFSYNQKFASVWSGGEGCLKVFYMAGAFKKAANSGIIWICAQAIIHEASHLEVGTRDFQYDIDGLKPGISFAPELAINNADSWGYFCLDLCGYLSLSDRKRIIG